MGSIDTKSVALLENGTLIAEHWTTCLECHVTHDEDCHYCETAEKLFAERRWLEWEPKTTTIQ